MSPRRLIPSPSWVALLLVAVALSALFVRLGFWQLSRLEERREFNASLARAEREAPVALEGLEPGDAEYRRVAIEGEFVPSDEFVLYGRSLDEERGNHVLTPMRSSEGDVVVVDRGWVPFELDDPPIEEARPPEGPVEAVGVLFPFEREGGTGESDVMPFVDRGRIEEALGEPVYPLYLRLQEQEPAPGALPRIAPLPEPSEGPHLGYAVQWFLFAAIALVGYVVLALRSADHEPASPQPRA